MGAIFPPKPVLLMVAASSRYAEALAWGRTSMETVYGPTAIVSEAFEFGETSYYLADMGSDLRKQFWCFRSLVDPKILADVKVAANAWETAYASLGAHPEKRPLNLDPGYLTLAKLVLASTKDHAHRLYLNQGVYAELTLQYRGRAWQPLPWTYPDYRRPDYQAFLDRCRELLRTPDPLPS